MPCWAHQRQLSYQPKQEKEFTQNLKRTPDDWDDEDANDPAPSSGGLSVGVKPEGRDLSALPETRPKATTTHPIIGSAQWAKKDRRMRTRDWAMESWGKSE